MRGARKQQRAVTLRTQGWGVQGDRFSSPVTVAGRAAGIMIDKLFMVGQSKEMFVL